MKLAFNIVDWQAVAPALTTTAEWQQWARQPARIDRKAKLTGCVPLPAMIARRLNTGSRLAAGCGLALVRRQQVDALVFCSRHGELESNFQLLTQLAHQNSLSPTDFVMSVHNSAAGNLAIAAKISVPATSLSAGIDTFQQALCEVHALQSNGYHRVLLVDFDGAIPDFYQPWLPPAMPDYSWAVALLLDTRAALHCTVEPVTLQTEPELPQGLQFLHGWLAGHSEFRVTGERLNWCWRR